MKRKLLFKTIIVAAMLGIGTSAWADVILFTAPTDNGDGTYSLNGSTYTKTTYDFTNTVPAKGDGTSKTTQENQTMAGYTDDPVTRSYVVFSTPVSAVYPGLTFTKTEGSSKSLYYYVGKGLRTDGATTLTITAQSERTLAVLHYTTGDGTTTVAGGTKHTIAKKGANLSFSLGTKNASPYYIYTSLDVYEEISVGNFVYDSTTGYYKKNGANYVRITYDFAENKGYGTSNGNSVAGFSNTGIKRYYSNSISSATTDYYDSELTFTPSKSTRFYWCIDYGMQFDETVYLKPTTADKYTVAYLYYKQGDAGGTYAAEEVAESCESITGASSQFTLYEKNDPRYLYTSMVVFQEVGIGDFYSDGDGCYYTYSDLTSKTSPYYRITYDFTSYTYSTDTKTGSGYVPSGFNETTGTRYQTTIAKNGKSNSSIPTGLTFLNSSTTSDAYVQYYAGMGLQAGTAALTLSVTNATANTVSYLYYKQGDEGKTKTVAAASEESTPITISGTASEVLPVKTTSYKLYTRLEVFTKDVPVTVSAAGKGWATLYTQYPLDFSGVSGLTAYTATIAESTVTLTPVENVPANTGVVLKSTTTNADVVNNIPVIASSSTDKGSLEGSATNALAYDANDTYNYYMLKLNANDEAQFSKLTSGTIAAGKAYLKIEKTNAPAMFNVVFADDNTTGVNDVRSKTADVRSDFYDLQGRKVANPTKGLYIVNGKKVIIK